MQLQSQLHEDMKAALKAGERQRLSVIRMLLSEVNNAAFAPRPVTAEQAVAAYGKRLRKSLEEFEKLGKTEQVDTLRAEIAIVEEYLPQKPTPAETEALVDAFLASHDYAATQLGQAMGAFMKEHGSGVDGALVNRLLREKITGKDPD